MSTARAEDCFRLFTLGGNGARSGDVFVFVCYLDDSDNDRGPMMALGGYMAKVERWIEFERDVGPFLDRNNVRTLRGVDFNSGLGDFENWDGAKKSDFVEGLYQIVDKHALHGISCVVAKENYQSLRSNYAQFTNMSPLGVAFGTISNSLLNKDLMIPSEAGNLINDEPLSFMVESGNKNNGNLMRYFEFLKGADWTMSFRLGSFSIVGKHDCRAIQIADFFVFHMRRESERWHSEGFKDSKMLGHTAKIMANHRRFRIDRLFGNDLGPSKIDMFDPWRDDEIGMTIPNRGLK